MYKVFVNDSPIIITSSTKKENIFPVYNFKNVVILEIIDKLRNNELKGINLYSTDLEQDWKSFLSNMKLIPAAGGLVLNPENNVLFIYRNGIWDLPKGWVEKGETIETAAIREVEEECGITNLTLRQPLITTYHIYFHKGIKLKQTYWFLMSSDYSDTLTPQLEEGITEVGFKNKSEIKTALKNTYANIHLVYQAYIDTCI
ncbi:NUDIX domain-containing protein [Polaribacter sp. Z014]|uniref:NUDIX hydrolase n=1 Tax=unclassified Polaribacter TaxID=196858 RepID=UPI00193C7312|nr:MULTISPECIES: NUDIX domain-containing protein [unclassified Polaribacter]MCL7763250.1 NUDIX domain-containing protein [Polaribacter sp. Z014]QVY67190.1 NUDIX domain-containing protein [Polaribacter sp. Q13]